MKATRVHAGQSSFLVELDDERYFRVPWSVSQKLAAADEFERDVTNLLGSGRGIHWPLLDEDLSVEMLVRDYGPHR